MPGRTRSLLKATLSTLYYTGGHRALAPITQGLGVIFMLHHVTPDGPREFDPNGILRVSPEFLRRTIDEVLAAGFEIVSLDEAHFRLSEGEHDRFFACFTLDDGYRDNLEHAYPIFKSYAAPMTVYVPSAFPDGNGDLWWLALEKVIERVDRLTLKMDGVRRQIGMSTPAEKTKAFDEIYWWLRRIDEAEARSVVHELCRAVGYDPRELATDLPMSWSEIRQLAADPLVTIGAHTRNHLALAKLSEAAASAEILEGARRLQTELGRWPAHLSYPYGSPDCCGAREYRIAKELGFKTAVTTRKGVVYPEHAAHLTALPRVSLNGDFQDLKYLKVFLSGAPFALLNGFRRVHAA